jgi:hypothetical protein
MCCVVMCCVVLCRCAMICIVSLLSSPNSTHAQVGLRLTLDNIVANTKVLSVQINDVSYISDAYRISELRPVERALYRASSNGVHTTVIFDNLSVSQAEARFSMYTTLFVTFLLVVSRTSTWQIEVHLEHLEDQTDR